MITCDRFEPWPALIESKAHPLCNASVIIPVRNEEQTIAETLSALAIQSNLKGELLCPSSFEVLILLNNCLDRSADRARDWSASHPELVLHIIERQLDGQNAHVGTARRWLMDTAWHRLNRFAQHDKPIVSGILSTDSDTVVRPDWIAQNIQALEAGADAVGGLITLKEEDLESLPIGASRAYQSDRIYQSLVARLEDKLDPQDGDPWPRHLEHFGASLACATEAYAKAGGMPDVSPLEDVAFIDRLRRQGARIRHAPSVVVSTSARFNGRAEVGLSFQLREWQRLSERNEEHLVPSARWLMHRFKTLSKLRQMYRSAESLLSAELEPEMLVKLAQARSHSTSVGEFLGEIDCDRIIEESFAFEREQPISIANRELRAAIKRPLPDLMPESVHVTSL